jgi:hypothetical protein
MEIESRRSDETAEGLMQALAEGWRYDQLTEDERNASAQARAEAKVTERHRR